MNEEPLYTGTSMSPHFIAFAVFEGILCLVILVGIVLAFRDHRRKW